MVVDAIRERFEGAVGACTAILVTALLVTLAGTGVVLARSRESVPPGADIIAGGGAGHVTPRVPASAPPGDPLWVRIPAIGVVADLVRLGISVDGTLEVPPYEEAGWYAGGSRPGDPGPAVIAAHLDSTDGPAVFYRLEELNPGDVVHVGYRDGTVTFTVSETRSFAKTHFPTGRVYGWTEGPELRLVTCGATFDRNTGAYTSNLVVWAKVEASA